ncbi:MAG: LacI family transcriptional regulator [Dorea sp.]|jgi:LacI family transcriptional regulator|nr:LacI family transcriptional regulator [Dorea sp.]MCI9453709.1 LacI family transcriptional regulator [Dorea sp.]
MEESRITGRAIAKRLGISPATVSLALNGRPGVNPKTREAILACQETLSRQEDKMFPDKILLISAEISSPSDHGLFKQSYTELYRILNNHGYLLQSVTCDDTSASFSALLEQLPNKQIAGAIIFAVNIPFDSLQFLKTADIPLMLFDCDLRLPTGDNLLIDNYGGVNDAVEFLIGHGHQDIWYLCHSAEYNFNFTERRRAFKQITDSLGIRGHMFELSGELREIRTRGQDFLNSLSRRPLPVLTENYQISLGILGAAQQLGLCVPKDLDIVCFDELPEETLLPWPVPMIRIFHGKKAAIAAKRLIDRIEGRTDINISYSFRTELINHSIGDKS